MYLGKELEKGYNYILLNLQNLIYHLLIIQNYFQIKLFGLLMILMYIELLFIKRRKEI